MFVNVPVAFGQFLENFGKSSESGRNSSELNRQKRYQCAYIINKNGYLRVWNISSLSATHLTRALRSLVFEM